jgi:hypothetical protein
LEISFRRIHFSIFLKKGQNKKKLPFTPNPPRRAPLHLSLLTSAIPRRVAMTKHRASAHLLEQADHSRNDPSCVCRQLAIPVDALRPESTYKSV